MQLVDIHGLSDEIIRPRLHPLEVALLPAGRGDENKVRVAVTRSGADAPTQLGSVHLGHGPVGNRSEEHTSELQSHSDLVCRLLLEKKKKKKNANAPAADHA